MRAPHTVLRRITLGLLFFLEFGQHSRLDILQLWQKALAVLGCVTKINPERLIHSVSSPCKTRVLKQIAPIRSSTLACHSYGRRRCAALRAAPRHDDSFGGGRLSQYNRDGPLVARGRCSKLLLRTCKRRRVDVTHADDLTSDMDNLTTRRFISADLLDNCRATWRRNGR